MLASGNCAGEWEDLPGFMREQFMRDAAAALEAAAQHIAAQALADAADVLYDLPIENMECYAIYEEWKDALNVNHGIQAATRWLHARAEFIKGAK